MSLELGVIGNCEVVVGIVSPAVRVSRSWEDLV